MEDELTTAKLKIAELEERLNRAPEPRKQIALEKQIETALERLEAIEKRYKTPETKEEEEEEDGDQCPSCGGTLYEMEDGVYKCSLCNQIWVENEK